MHTVSYAMHRGPSREAKHMYSHRISTLEDKVKRHRRKARIWRRAVKRLAQNVILAEASATS